MNDTPEWKRHETHENEVREIFQRLGFLNERGEVTRFDGSKFWPAMAAAGHSSTAFSDCDCKREPQGASEPPSRPLQVGLSPSGDSGSRLCPTTEGVTTMRTRTTGLGFIESKPVPSGTMAHEDGCSFCDREGDNLRQIRQSKRGTLSTSIQVCGLCRLDLIHHLSARD